MKNFKVGSSNITIGEFTYGESNLGIKEWGEGANLVIGKFCSLGDDIKIYLGGNHRVDWITTYPFGHTHQHCFGGVTVAGHPATRGDIVIGSDVWIGSDVKILSGIQIGNGAVVAGSSVITRDVPAYSVVGGNPGRLIKMRFSDDIINLLNELAWWDLAVDKIVEIKDQLSSAPTPELLKQLISKYKKEN